MSPLERAEDTIRQGNLAMARQQLASLVVAGSYDPELAARIGRIALDLGDRWEAGRWYLLSAAVGDEVEQCVELFVRGAGNKPEAVVLHLPHALCAHDVDDYAPAARGRIDRYGLRDVFRELTAGTSDSLRSKLRDGVVASGCLLVLLALFTALVVGFVAIIRWLW